MPRTFQSKLYPVFCIFPGIKPSHSLKNVWTSFEDLTGFASNYNKKSCFWVRRNFRGYGARWGNCIHSASDTNTQLHRSEDRNSETKVTMVGRRDEEVITVSADRVAVYKCRVTRLFLFSSFHLQLALDLYLLHGYSQRIWQRASSMQFVKEGRDQE
jgi:hypothetical protein